MPRPSAPPRSSWKACALVHEPACTGLDERDQSELEAGRGGGEAEEERGAAPLSTEKDVTFITARDLPHARARVKCRKGGDEIEGDDSLHRKVEN